MIAIKPNEDIALSSADAVVNASNGIGYMGGQMAVISRKKGVAESIQYISRGEVEKLARNNCRKHSLFGYPPGSVFVTTAPNMKTGYIIHAVTMRMPGSRSKLKHIEALVPKIVNLAERMNFTSVAIPLLGCGTGGLDESKVYEIFLEHLRQSCIDFFIYT